MKRSSSRFAAATAAIAFAQVGTAIQLDTNNVNSIKAAAGEVVKGLYAYHNEAATTGQFNQPQPWYWWLSGSGWTGIMDYTVYTKDTTYKADLLSALSKNVGPKFDFSPPEQAGWEANDDQAYWVYNALTAMEYGFDTLPGAPAWDVIATNAFNLWVSRWNAETDTCNGGLKWQYNPSANGWTYKNAVTNGAFFQTAARLARYTGDQKFADWAIKIWDWSTGVGIVSDTYHVYDGTSDDNGANCSAVNKVEWSYNIATYLHGAAQMANFTGEAAWEERVHGLVETAAATFFKSGIMFEQNCEPSHACTTDQTSFKSSLSRWLGKTAVLVPSSRQTIMNLLDTSAAAAAKSCVGNGKSTCGLSWTGNGFDGQSDFGVELSALETIQSLLVFQAPPLAGVGSHNAPEPSSSKTAGQTSTETPIQTPTRSPIQTLSQTPSETHTEAPTQTPNKTHGEAPSKTPSETHTEAPTQPPSENHTMTLTETHTETPVQTPVQTPTSKCGKKRRSHARAIPRE